MKEFMAGLLVGIMFVSSVMGFYLGRSVATVTASQWRVIAYDCIYTAKQQTDYLDAVFSAKDDEKIQDEFEKREQ